MKSKLFTKSPLATFSNCCSNSQRTVSSNGRNKTSSGKIGKAIFLLAGFLFLVMSWSQKVVAQATKLSTIQGNFQMDDDLYTRRFQFPDSCKPFPATGV